VAAVPRYFNYAMRRHPRPALETTPACRVNSLYESEKSSSEPLPLAAAVRGECGGRVSSEL
jgi:hypothetical protein